jgi:uncharacterized protein YndB with AHSA1/START domain
MMTSTHSATIPADPDAVFRTITDIDGLPDWNDTIREVVDGPEALVIGAEWVVEMHALGQNWLSRSTLMHHDPGARRFTYRSCTDDGNPSWADWEWSVLDHPAGTEVTVTWDLHPVTFWRRTLLAHVRNRQLARTEVPASLAALSRHVAASNSSP